MMFRAFFAGSAPLRRLSPLQNKKLGIFATFCDCGLLSAPLGPKTAVFAAFWGCESRFGATRQSLIAKKLQSEPIFCFWVPGEAPKQCWSVAGPIRDGGCVRCGAGWTRYGVGVLSERRAMCCPGAAGVLLGCGIVMWPRCGVTKHGWRCGLGRLPAYRAASLLSRKISNATLLKLVFRYNGRRGFVEDQASD